VASDLGGRRQWALLQLILSLINCAGQVFRLLEALKVGMVVRLSHQLRLRVLGWGRCLDPSSRKVQPRKLARI